MQVTETLSEGLKRAYTVVVPAADIESKRRSQRLAELGKTLTLPGFRPGQDAAAGGAPALRHRGDRRGAGGNRSTTPPSRC